jgi:quercetin dioxygenase-like cupin family protein
MRLFQFNRQPTRTITDHDSLNAAISLLLRRSNDVFLVCIRLDAGGILGYHQATGDQLFVVVEGSGWVRAEGMEPTPITTGQAAFWQSGEWHETTTDTGLTALVVEGGKLYLAELEALPV